MRIDATRMTGGVEPVDRVRASPAAAPHECAGCAPRMSCDAEAAVRFARGRKVATRALQACNANSCHRPSKEFLSLKASEPRAEAVGHLTNLRQSLEAAQGFRFRVEGLGFRVKGLGLRV